MNNFSLFLQVKLSFALFLIKQYIGAYNSGIIIIILL